MSAGEAGLRSAGEAADGPGPVLRSPGEAAGGPAPLLRSPGEAADGPAPVLPHDSPQAPGPVQGQVSGHDSTQAPGPAASDPARREALPLGAERPAVEADPTAVGAQHMPSRRPRSLRTWSVRRVIAVSAGLVLLCVLVAYLVSGAQPTVYGAQADVLYKVPGSSQEAERQLATQQVLLSSRGVLAPVAERFDVPLAALTASQQVEILAGSEILRLQVRNEDAGLAVRLAQAIADSYIASVSTSLGDIGSEQERQLRDQITDLSVAAAAGRTRLDEIAALRAAGGVTAETSREERRLQIEDTTLTQRISTLQAQLTELLIQGENARPAEILTPAYLLDEPVGPKPVRAAAAGAMVGLLLAGGLLAVVLRGRSFFVWP